LKRRAVVRTIYHCYNIQYIILQPLEHASRTSTETPCFKTSLIIFIILLLLFDRIRIYRYEKETYRKRNVTSYKHNDEIRTSMPTGLQGISPFLRYCSSSSSSVHFCIDTYNIQCDEKFEKKKPFYSHTT